MSAREPASIAVVGMACWYPGARSPRELWENILARRQEFRAFLEERMPARDYHDTDPDAPDKTYGTQGAFLDGFRFDPTAWRVPKSTYLSTDIAHWLALDVAARALADAGYPQGEGLARDRTGVIVGNSLTGEQARANSMRLRWPFVRRIVAAEARRHLPADRVEPMVEAVGERYRSHFPATNEDTLAGALSNTIAGRICGTFDLGGGGYVVDGACASSLLAVCTAAAALEEGRVDACLAGGVDISMDPFELVGFAKARALSPTEMRVYDRRGNGFIPGEGSGFVVLKRLADARAAGDRVYAVLQGWGVASDGRNAITAPKVAGQARAIRAAWARSGRPDFVEGHGTGTAVGDKVELEAIAQAASDTSGEGRAVGVTSLKSILGHTKAAAGIGAFLKAVVAANRRVLPPTAGCGEPNPVFDGAARALYPIRRGEVRGAGAVVKAGASAMGFGGINTHAVVVSGDAPDPSLAPSLSEEQLLASWQDTELFVFGAASLADLRAQVHALRPVAARIARSELVDLAEALLARVPANPTVRAAVVAGTPKELVARLDRLVAIESADGPDVWLDRPLGPPRLAFLCPGQGSQDLESARVLLARDPALAAEARRLAAVAEAEGCPGLLDALYPPLDRAVTADELAAARARLTATEMAQPALCLVSLLWARRLAALGLAPSVVAGHSLGELSAFALAGTIDDATLVRLAVHRGKAMASPSGRPGGMVSLATDVATAQSLCAAAGGYAAVANVNTPRQVVVAGEVDALDRLVDEAGRRGVPARRLAVANGFHSELVADAAARLAEAAPVPDRAAAPRVTLLSSMVDAPIAAGCDLRAHVSAHVRSPVDFVGLVRRVAARADLLVEVGSGRVLSGLVDAVLDGNGPRCLPVEGTPGRAADLQAVLAAAWIRGAALRWSALHEGRLVRPFVAPAERVFIVNPCEAGREDEAELPAPRALLPAAAAVRALLPEGGERAPRADEGTAPAVTTPDAAAILARLLDRVAEKTGFDRASLTGEQRLRDDLNLDSIKAGEIVAAAARELGVADRVDPAQLTPSPLGEIASALAGIPGVSVESPGSWGGGRAPRNAPPVIVEPQATRHPAAVADVPGSLARGEKVAEGRARGAAPGVDLLPWLLDRVAEKTGFDKASLSADQRLQEDLNLDSIKAGEIVAAAARHAGVADRVDPAQFLRQPMGAIARALGELAGTVGAPADAPSDGAATPGAPTNGAATNGAATNGAAINGAAINGVATNGAPPNGAAINGVATNGAPPNGAATPADPAARWVRTFGLATVPSTAPATPDWTGARVRVLAPDPLRPAIEAALAAAGAAVDPAGPDVVAVLAAADTPARVHELRAVVDALTPSARSLLLVQRLDGHFGLRDPRAGPAGAAFARSISLERPHLAVQVVDLAAGLPEDALLAALRDARPAAPGFAGLGVDAAGRWALDARPLAAATFPARADGLRPGELVLVTGGARGITAACAEALARETGVRLALVGSTPRERVDDDILKLLGRLALAGIEARYWSCDLARPDDVAAMVAAVRAAQGPIAAVVHGAGRNTPRRVETVSAADALAEVAPKLLGGEALLAALDDAPPRLVVALTSIIGVSGMLGNAWYAFANEALDLAVARFAARHSAPSGGTAAVSLAYGVWSDIGMGHKMGSVGVLARMGIGALDPAEGVARFLSAVTRDPGVRQPIVTAHVDGLPTWPARLPEDAALRFLDGARSGVPGVEARVRLVLHPDRDTWLRDHDFKGSLLLPTVFGLEAMAQAAWLARGGGADAVVAFSDVELPAPVVVAPEGTRIELVARVREDAPDTVDCEVRTEQSGFARAHFATTVRFGAAEPGEARELPMLAAPEPRLVPGRDLYGGLLFQGSAFHRLGEITGGEGRAMRFEAEVRAPEGERWLAGDPFLRDALLQAGQVLVAQDDALPVRIARIGLAAGHAAAGPLQGYARIVDSKPRRHVGAVEVVDAAGRRTQWLEGYEVQVLAHHPDRPDTEAILRPRGAAAARVCERIGTFARERGLVAPTVGLFDVALHARPAAERRDAVRGLLATLEPSAAPRWSDDGRPSLADGRGLSVAHDDGACLLVVAADAVGCDLEPIRPRADWSDLLGADRARLLPALRATDDFHAGGTRVWAAGEALHKAGAGHAAPEVVRRDGDLVELRSGAFHVVTFPVALERGPTRMLAVAFGPAPASHATVAPLAREAAAGAVAAVPAGSAVPVPDEAPPTARPPIDPTLLMLSTPPGRPSRMDVRFVVTFDEASSLSGRVPAVTLASWMGRLRELAIAGFRGPIVEALGSGLHGMVTQNAWVRLHGEARALDRVEARLWCGELRPSSCLLRYAFDRVTDTGEREPIGEAAQRFGWVDIVGHGLVKAAPIPDFLYEFLEGMHQDGPQPAPRPLLIPTAPAAASASFATTLVEGNAVGNLYYANYFKWAQRVIDQLVFRHAPEACRARGELGELVLSSMRVEYMREAMPFETIEVSIHPAPAEEGDVAFDVVFQRVEGDGTRTRLALGRLEGTWCRWTSDGRLPVSPPPWAPRPATLETVQ